MNHPIDEMLDLVDGNDVVIGSKKRSEIYAERLSNFRVINAFIKNSEGKLWIPRRTATKRIFPLCLDVSVGGHVESGETYEDAFARETEEELGIIITDISFGLLGHLTPHQDNVSAFMNVYEIWSDETPTYNQKDFVEYYWLTAPEVFDRLTQGDISKGDLPKLIKKFYL